jgi:hypothetical protein
VETRDAGRTKRHAGVFRGLRILPWLAAGILATGCTDPAAARRAAEITDLEGQRAMLTTRISAGARQRG